MNSANDAIIRRFVGGPLLTTCFAIVVPNQATMIIDAPRDAWRAAIELADEHHAPVQLAIMTHGHWDHIAGLADLIEQNIPTAGNQADAPLFADPMSQRTELPFVIEPATPERWLIDGDRLDLAGLDVQVIHTPGHTPGGISIWFPELDALFTGDTVLKGGAGYLDRPEADARALAASVRRIAALPDETRLYPGHGAPTTIGRETWLADAEDPETLIADWLAGRRRWTPRAGR